MCTASSPLTTGEHWRPSSTDFQTSVSSRSRRDLILATASGRYATRPPFEGVRTTTTVTNWVKRPDWSESVPTWTDWPSRLASSTKRRMSGILTSPSVFHIAYLFEKRVEEGERFELSRHSRALPGSGRVPYQLGEPSRRFIWRRGRDSNPRGTLGLGGLAVRWAPHSPVPLQCSRHLARPQDGPPTRIRT